MSQISQPVRIALLAVIVIAAAWFMLLRPKPSSTSSPAPTPTPAAGAAAPAPTAAAPANTGTLPPGVAGLSRAVQKARDALSASQTQAKAAEQANPTVAAATPPATAAASAASATSRKPAATAAASHPTGAPPAPAATTPSSTSPAASAATAPAAPAAATASSATGAARALAGPVAPTAGAAAAAAPSAAIHPATHPAAPAAAPVGPAKPAAHATPVVQVQQELSQGKTAVILFWSPSGSDDQSVRQELRHIDLQDGNVVTHVATPDQVTAYGTVTTNVSVLGTPTIVIVNPKGQASTLTGLVDAKAINQAVNDAEQSAGTDQLPQLTAFTPSSPRAAYVKRVNQMCTRAITRAGVFHFSPGSAPSAAAAFSWLTAVNDQLLNNVLKLAPPANDGAYIDLAAGHERRSLSEVNAAVAAGAAGQPQRERDLLLQAQADDDRAAIMFSTYGLTGCISR